MRYSGIAFGPELYKRNGFLDGIKSESVNNDHIKFAKKIHDGKTKTRDEFDEQNKWRKRNRFVHSTRHTEDELFLGILGEFMVALKYGVDKNWVREQQKQVDKIRETGVFDTTDVGRTQVRTVDYNPKKLTSIIVREQDFHNKSGQPIIGCVFSRKNMWIKICGWIEMENIKNNPDVDYGDPNCRRPAFWVPLYILNPMSTFNKEFLS